MNLNTLFIYIFRLLKADDLIVLGGCGLKFTWRFPQSTQCPVKNCKIQFGKRSDAIDHYKVNHAKKTTLCPACNSPILMRSFGDIAFHYRKRHPNKDLPLCFKSPYERKKMDNKHAKIKANSENGSQAMKVVLLFCLNDSSFIWHIFSFLDCTLG